MVLRKPFRLGLQHEASDPWIDFMALLVGNHHVSMSTCDSWSADLKILVPNMNPGYLNST